MAESPDDVIRSRDNRILKFIRSLRKRAVRESERAFVVEGIRAVEDALDSSANARVIAVRADSDWRPKHRVPYGQVHLVAPPIFNELSETETPQPVLAVFDVPKFEPVGRADPLFLVVDGVQDPGNLGTLLRSAAAVAVDSVLIAPGTVDPYNGKVVRAGMGAHFRVPIAVLDGHWTRRIERQCPIRVLAEAGGELTYDAVSWVDAAALIVGSEAHGPTEVGRSMANATARIPLGNGVESLNAGVAGSIFLFEADRQRRTHSAQ